jgi:3-dehydroquinate dehydratase-2
MYNILIMNGPNLNLLGKRDAGMYGNDTWEDIQQRLSQECLSLGVQPQFYQSNHEGDLVDFIQSNHGKIDGIAINAGALTHYGYSLKDALIDSNVPIVEVHMSNPYGREEWRRHSVLGDIVQGIITGFGWMSYILAIKGLLNGCNE